MNERGYPATKLRAQAKTDQLRAELRECLREIGLDGALALAWKIKEMDRTAQDEAERVIARLASLGWAELSERIYGGVSDEEVETDEED